MPIIIGGPPSSGSSLLSVILNRHSKITCIQETHLLTKQDLYLNWSTQKKKIKAGRLHSPGWHQYSKIDLPDQEAGNFDTILVSAISVSEFANLYFSEIARIESKEIWAEKTPANVYFFHQISSDLQESQFILTIRHPYDIIASLLERGKSNIDAVSLCLLNMGIGFIQSKSIPVKVVKYEDLVQTPTSSIQQLCNFLNIDFELTMLDSSEKPEIKMKGWNHYEDGPIKSDSINRFDKLAAHQQNEIFHLCEDLVINYDHVKKYNIPLSDYQSPQMNINYLIEQYEYHIKHTEIVTKQDPSFIKDKMSRLIKLHPSFKPYPILSKQSTAI